MRQLAAGGEHALRRIFSQHFFRGQVVLHLVLRKTALGDQALLAALDFLQHIKVVLDVLVSGS